MRCCVADDYGWCDEVDILVTHEGEDYCIFHAPAECEEKLAKWDNSFVFRLIRKESEQNASCNLSGTVFPLRINFREFGQSNKLPHIDFSSTFFAERVFFRRVVFGGYVDFKDAVFNKAAHFDTTIFAGRGSFSDTRFKADAIFKNSTFSEYADFSDVFFDKYTIFLGSTFDKAADFTKAIFGQEASESGTNFSGATFGVDAFFENSIFNGDANFCDSTFRAGADFSGVKFKKDANFESATFVASSFFSPAFFSTVSFTETKFEVTAYFSQAVFVAGNFQNCHVGGRLEFDRADLRGLSLLGSPIESFRFISCDWPTTNTRNVVYDAREVKGRGYFSINNVDKSKLAPFDDLTDVPKPKHLEDLFRRLKKVAKDESDEMMASDWHYNEKEMQQRRLSTSNKGLKWSKKAWRTIFLQGLLKAYKWVSGYGEDPLRAAFCFLGLITIPLFFNGLVTPTPFPGEFNHYLPLVKSSIPASVISAPRLAAFWQLIITIQAALFAFALRNKFRR